MPLEMTAQEITELLGIPFPVIRASCRDESYLRIVISLAYHTGIREGLFKTHSTYNKLLQGKDKIASEG